MRADRLISLMLLLHSRGKMTARNLAEHLEVSERTIYRDLDALSAAGIPVYAQSGPDGGLYLDEHYRVSLTGLSVQDVQALFVASDAGPLKDLGMSAKTDTLLKLFAELPSTHRSKVEQLRQRFYIDSRNWFQIVESASFLPLLQQAVWEDRRIEIHYQPVEGRSGARVLDAYGLVAKANIWYLVGKKPDSPEMHSYRVGRFQQVILTDEHFARDLSFDLAIYWQESCEQFERISQENFPSYPAILRVHPDTFWYFPGYMEGCYQQIGEPDNNGWLTLRVIFQSFGEARGRILGLGAGVEVIEPAELRCAVIETARAILAYYGNKGGSLSSPESGVTPAALRISTDKS